MFSKLAPLSARLVRAPKLAVAMRPAVRTFAAAAGGAKTGVMSIPARYPMAFGMAFTGTQRQPPTPPPHRSCARP